MQQSPERDLRRHVIKEKPSNNKEEQQAESARIFASPFNTESKMLGTRHTASRSADKPMARYSLEGGADSGEKELTAQPMVVETEVTMRQSLLDQ